jgi:hypothetical protein
MVIMVRGRHGGRRRGARGGGVTPPTTSMPEGSKPQGVEQDEFSFVEMASEAKLLHLAFWLPYCSVFLSILNVG